MKRFHVHVAVADLEQSTRFYSSLFAAPPTVKKDDYAKWMLDDPRVNFAISQRGGATGLNHMGLQVDSADELEELHTRLQQADASIVAEAGANCCYAKSDKYWVQDPAGIAWESFHTLGAIPMFGADDDTHQAQASTASGSATCCPAPTASIEAAPKSACCK